MNKRIVGFCFIACAVVALSNPTPAKARAAIAGSVDVTSVMVNNQYETGPFIVCGITFNYRQRINLPGGGGPMWVPVDSFYTNGSMDAVLLSTCEEGGIVYGIYGLGSCTCITGAKATADGDLRFIPETELFPRAAEISAGLSFSEELMVASSPDALLPTVRRIHRPGRINGH